MGDFLWVGAADDELVPAGFVEVLGSVPEDGRAPHPFAASEAKAAPFCEFAKVVGDLEKAPGRIRQ